MSETNKVTVKQGFAGNLTITIKDADGNAQDLSAATIYFHVKAKKTDTTYLLEKSTSSGVTTSSATGGIITVALTRAETLSLTKNCTAEIIIKYSATNIAISKDIELVLVKSVNTGTLS